MSLKGVSQGVWREESKGKKDTKTVHTYEVKIEELLF